MKYCTKCGYQMADDMQFCAKCGTKAENIEDVNGQPQSSIGTKVDTTDSSPKKKISKKKLSAVFSLSAIAIVVLGIFAYFLFLPFSKNTKAIEKATASVVKIYCYDYEGNESATGSGFIAFDDQTVVTNYHVMEEAYTCKISTEEDKTYEVESILAYSEEYDLAILKLSESTGLEVLSLGSAEKIKKGEVVTAIGSPLGIKNTVSQGVLSGRKMEGTMDALQFTAAISSGSSGGALFNEKGKVIGVTYASYVNGQNLNLAIPAELVKELYDEKGSERKVNAIHLKTYPYIKYLKKYDDVIEVTIDELRNRPLYYAGKMIKVTAFVSTKNYYETAMDVSPYPIETKDEAEIGTMMNLNDFETHGYISMKYSDDAYEEVVEIGDSVTVIGEFKYVEKGDSYELLEGVEWVAYANEASIKAFVIYNNER